MSLSSDVQDQFLFTSHHELVGFNISDDLLSKRCKNIFQMLILIFAPPRPPLTLLGNDMGGFIIFYYP